MKQRNHAFDFLCGICIVRMMMLHVMSFCQMQQQDWWMEVMHWTYFFMSFFFFKAGYFNKTVGGDTRAFLVKKTKQLIVPYTVWGVLGAVVYLGFAWLVLPSNNTMVKNVTLEHRKIILLNCFQIRFTDIGFLGCPVQSQILSDPRVL